MSIQANFTLRGRNPDVLTCIANLSNDEVFTPPEFANRMLDTLAEAWAALSCKFLAFPSCADRHLVVRFLLSVWIGRLHSFVSLGVNRGPVSPRPPGHRCRRRHDPARSRAKQAGL